MAETISEAYYREALESVALARKEADDDEHHAFDWQLLALKMEDIARHALGLEGHYDGRDGTG